MPEGEIKPQVMHTEDEPYMRTTVSRLMEKLGISVRSFDTNDAASLHIEESTGQVFAGAIIDYHTASSLSGVDLIAALFESKICGEVLILSSSTERSTLIEGLVRKDYVDAMGKKCVDTIEIFDKFNEFALAAIYVAIRIKYPQINISRASFYKVLEIDLDSEGNLRNANDVFELNGELMKSIIKGEFNLDEFVKSHLNVS